MSSWWSALDRSANAPRRASLFIPASLGLAVVAAVAAMPLAWHHLHIPGDSFALVNGLTSASWLLAVAVAALVLAIRASLAAPGLGLRWAITVLALITINGMFFDYFDWSTRGVSLYVAPYYGPGFFVGLVSAALTAVAAILVWRARD